MNLSNNSEKRHFRSMLDHNDRKKEYLRDKRSPKPLSESVSRVMSKNKAKNTKPELLLRKALWNNGIKGYRLHPKNIQGKPDICFISKKMAVFVNGCFWHRCPHCNYMLPKHNTQFWKNKFENNMRRDKEKEDILKNEGWKVLIVWECELKGENIALVINKIEYELL